MHPFDLDQAIFDLTDKVQATDGTPPPSRVWKIRHAVEGVQVFGGIGSGKTSGSGYNLAKKYLAAQFGGLVLTAKPDEKDLWWKYCEETGRLDDLMIVEPSGQWTFNFLDYEAKASGAENALTENVVQVLKTVIHASEEREGGGSKDPFWDNSLDMLLFNVIDFCKLAYDTVSVKLLYDIVQSLPKPPVPKPPSFSEDVDSSKGDGADRPGAPPKTQTAYDLALKAAIAKGQSKIHAWRKRQSPDRLRKLNEDKAARFAAWEAEIEEMRTLNLIHEFVESYKALGSKTRSVIDVSFSAFLFRLLREPVFSLFCNKSNFTPDLSRKEGKIILINLPVKTYHKVGRDCQIMFKYIWQRAMEKETLEDNARPVFLWADEAQHFLHEHDAEFQATARSSRIATVYLSQNLPNYYASMGGQRSEYRVKSFLGTLNTKFFHANADVETNRYAAELIGDTKQYDPTTGSSTGTDGNISASKSSTRKYDRAVRPEEFPRLKTGGPQNANKVQCYMHVQGDLLQNVNHKLLSFNQPPKEDKPKSLNP